MFSINSTHSFALTNKEVLIKHSDIAVESKTICKGTDAPVYKAGCVKFLINTIYASTPSWLLSNL